MALLLQSMSEPNGSKVDERQGGGWETGWRLLVLLVPAFRKAVREVLRRCVGDHGVGTGLSDCALAALRVPDGAVLQMARARCADEEEKKKRVDVSRGAAWHRGTLFSHGSRFAGGQKGIAGRVRGCSLKKYLLAQCGLGQPSEGLDRRSLKKNPGAGTVQQEQKLVERFGHTRRFVSLSAGCLSLFSLHPSSDATRSPRPSACHAMCSAHTAHHHGLREVLPASKCATSIHPWRPRLTDSGIACETRWQSWRLSSPRGALSTVTSRWRGGESPPRSTRPWTESALGTSWPTRGMDGPAWPRMSDGLRLGQRAPVPGGRLTPTCPRLRTPKPPMRRRWGTAC